MKSFTLHRTRAVLAGGAVLGLGAVATLALWSDSEFSIGAFRSLGFTVESAPAPDATFDSHDSAGEAVSLDFGLPTEGLIENESVEAEVWFRMGTEARGNVQVLAPTVARDDLNGYIDVLVTQGACGFNGQVLQQGLLESLGDAANPFPLPGGTENSPGEAQAVCIEASLRDVSDLRPGQYSTGRVAWEFVVTEEVA